MWFRHVLGWLIKFGLYDSGYLGLANLIVRNILFVHPVWEVSVRNSMKQHQSEQRKQIVMSKFINTNELTKNKLSIFDDLHIVNPRSIHYNIDKIL